MDMFKELQIDPAEFACLKAVVLFKPGPYLSLISSYPQEYFARSCWSQRQEGDWESSGSEFVHASAASEQPITDGGEWQTWN